MKNNLAKTKRKGFTLIELIIVLAVMAIIAAIAIPSFSAIRDNAATKADKQSLETVKRTALMLASDEEITDGTFKIKVSESSVTVEKTSPSGPKNTEEAGELKKAITVKPLKSKTGDNVNNTMTIVISGGKVDEENTKITYEE